MILDLRVIHLVLKYDSTTHMIRWKLETCRSCEYLPNRTNVLGPILFLSPKVVRRLPWSRGLVDCAGHGITHAEELPSVPESMIEDVRTSCSQAGGLERCVADHLILMRRRLEVWLKQKGFL